MAQVNVHRFAASFAQQRLWFIDQYESGSGLYNIPAAWRLRGTLDVQALQQALNELVRRHEALRTVVLADEEQEVVQAVATSLELAIQHTDLSAAPEPQTHLHHLLQAEANTPFDLSKGPLVRCGLVRLALDEHVLLLTMHHIVSDGWSMGVLMRELQLLYAAFTKGQPSPLIELPIQYADYALWQREWLQGAALQSQVNFWRKSLEGAPPLIELPLDRPRPAQLSHRGGFVPFELDAPSTAALRKLCQQAQVTAFMAVAALFNVLLHRYSRQDDICLGYPVAGRQRKELEGLIGFFVNTLVLRTRIDPRKSFLQLLAQVRESVLDADDHQDLPFEKLVEELKPERSLNHSPLFQVMLAYNNATGERLTLPGLEITPQSIGETQTAKFDLTLELTEAHNRLRGAIEYNSDLFDRSTIERMVGHFKTLFESVVANPNSRVQDLPLLTEAERHQILVEWNDTKTDFPRDKCIHQLFEEQVERSPDAVAVVFEDQQLTYAQLNAKANQLAHHLRGLGVKPDTLVAICVERSLEMVIGLLGILKSGGAYLPLDLRLPRERLTFMLEDSRASVLVAAGDAAKDTAWPSDVLTIDLSSRATQPRSEQNPMHFAASGCAYVIYTSGSTGKPKGVMVPHVSLANFLHSMLRRPGLTAGDVVAAVTTISFDIAALELYLPLLVGARTVVLSQETVSDGLRLVQQLLACDATVLQATPATWSMLIEAGWTGGESFRALCGGEGLPPDLAAALLKCTGELWNLYGPTETTVWSTAERVRGPRSISIGRPIDNTRVYVVDQVGEQLPVGVPGELLIGGRGVASGYLNRPDLTAEKFIPDPFGDPGSRMYKTGDLARYLPDGNIEFLGRIDHQVKIRGFRIELGEVEAALHRCDAVRKAVVLAREDQPGHKQLVAYVVPVSVAPAITDLRTQLSAFLPEYMVPSAWVFLDALPLNPNGKIDRAKLPAPSQLAKPREIVEPGNAAERSIVGLWAELLQVAPIGTHDNFFALGGNSLLAARLLIRVRHTHGIHIGLADFLQQPTVADLARRVVECYPNAGQLAVAPMSARLHQAISADGPSPLGTQEKRVSRTQAAHWSLALPTQRIFRKRRFVISRSLQVADEADPDRLAHAIIESVKLAGVFRYRLRRTPTDEVVADPLDPQLRQPTCQVIDEAQIGTTAYQEFVAEVLNFTPDAYDLHLVRTVLAKPTQGPTLWLFAAHHIVADEATIDLVQANAERIYAKLAPTRPSRGLDFYDYAEWTNKHFGAEQELAAREHWATRIPACPRLSTGVAGIDRPPVFSGEAHVARRFARRDRPGRRPFPLSACLPSLQLLAVFAATLCDVLGWDRFVVGTLRSERELIDEPHLAGYFVNAVFYVLPDLRNANDRVAEAASALRGQWAADTEHFWLPAATKMAHLPQPSDTGYVRRNQIDFYYNERRNEAAMNRTIPGLLVPAAAAPDEDRRAINDLVANLAATNDGVILELLGYKHFIDELSLQELAEAFQLAIEDIDFA